MKSRKGSMELGINAIVILIIALALLGLGIGFVTKLFTASQSKMVRIIDRTELPIHADASNQMVFDTSTLQVKQGTDERLIVSVYNEGSNEAQDVRLMSSQCMDSAGVPTAPTDISIVSPIQSIPAGLDSGYSAIVAVASGADKGSYICTIVTTENGNAPGFSDLNGASHNPSRQLFITVT